MLPYKSALALARAVRRRDISPVEVAEAVLRAVDRRNPALNAIIWRRDEALLAEARLAEAAVMRGDPLPPFHGVPIPIKDLTEVKDEPTTSGSVAAKDKIGRADASVVTSLRAAGFLFMGRTNTPEFGSLPVTENTLFGATRNPWDLRLTAGGSSGGAAAAVAAGMAPIAHASDGGGSIRIPASCCGLVGLKANRGRIPKGPVLSEIMHGFSTDGCVSTNIADTAALLDVLGKLDPTGWYGVQPRAETFAAAAARPPPRLRIGFTVKAPFAVEPSQSALDAVTKTATILADQGHIVAPADIAWPLSSEQLAQDFLAVWCSASAYNDLPDGAPIEGLNAGLRRMAQTQSTFDFVKAVSRLQAFSRRIVSGWGQDFDLLLMPTLAIEPPPIGWLYQTGATEAAAIMWRTTEMVPYTAWCNITGQPAISLPTYQTPHGLPVGVQLVAAPYREDLLLQVGRELEEAIGWDTLLPV